MKIKIKNEDIDIYVGSIEEKDVPQPEKSWRIPLLTRLKNVLNGIIGRFRSVGRQELPSFAKLTLGGYLRCTKCNKPSELVRVICEDLYIESLPDCQAISYYFYWKKQLETITMKFREFQPKVKDQPVFQMYWKQCTDRLHLPQHVWVVDKMAKRFNISYEQAYSMPVADVLTAVAIDCAGEEYEARVHQHYEQQSKLRKS